MGYLHDTHMSQYVPPTAFHYVTGTWVSDAGNVAGTIVQQKSAGAQTAGGNNSPLVPSDQAAPERPENFSCFDYF